MLIHRPGYGRGLVPQRSALTLRGAPAPVQGNYGDWPPVRRAMMTAGRSLKALTADERAGLEPLPDPPRSPRYATAQAHHPRRPDPGNLVSWPPRARAGQRPGLPVAGNGGRPAALRIPTVSWLSTWTPRALPRLTATSSTKWGSRRSSCWKWLPKLPESGTT